MERIEMSPPVRYAVWALVAVLGAGLLWLGVMRYQEEQRAVAAPTAGMSSAQAKAGLEPASDVTLSEPEPAPVLAVHVAGAVAQPGVYHLAEGARVADALAAAGGAQPEGVPDTLNLAARLMDGDKIYVPTKAELEASAEPLPAARGATQGPAGVVGAGSGSSARISVNRASAEELELVNGIGPAIARRIVEYRAQHGPFERLEDLEAVPGIGPHTLEKIKPYLTL